MYLFEVKAKAEMKEPWDYYKLVLEIPGEQAFLPLDKGGCPLVKNSARVVALRMAPSSKA